jgi:hypothetical protein
VVGLQRCKACQGLRVDASQTSPYANHGYPGISNFVFYVVDRFFCQLTRCLAPHDLAVASVNKSVFAHVIMTMLLLVEFEMIFEIMRLSTINKQW